MLCSGGKINGYQCFSEAIWRNKNGVEVCEHHRTVMDYFTWENRNGRTWESIKPEVCGQVMRVNK